MSDSGLWSPIWAAAWAAVPDMPLVAGASMLAGAALGAIFFGGLWWTVQRGAASAAPARWFITSLVVRTAIVLAGFYVGWRGSACASGAVPAWLSAGACHRAPCSKADRPAAAPPASRAPPCA